MAVYFVLFILLVLISNASKRYSLKSTNRTWDKDKTFLIICVVLLSLIEGLRAFTVGTDTHDYANSFTSLDYKYEAYEFLSKLLVDLVQIFSRNPTLYLITCALIVNGLIIWAIYHLSNNVRYSIFIFISLLFYFTSFNAMRQAIAYSFVFCSFYYIREKKLKKSAITLTIATLFHSSALIGLMYLIIPIISYRKKKNSIDSNFQTHFTPINNAVVIGITMALAMLAYLYFDVLLEYSSRYFPMYEIYLSNQFRDIGGGIQQPVVYSAIFICFVILVPNSAPYKKCYLLPLIMAVILSFASVKMAYIARLTYYFDITTVISIPYMLENNMVGQKSKMILKVIISAICIAFLLYGLLNNYMRVADYKFYWQM